MLRTQGAAHGTATPAGLFSHEGSHHIRLRQGFGGQEEHREQPFFERYVILRGKNPADRLPSV
jgi:hypothetical protein